MTQDVADCLQGDIATSLVTSFVRGYVDVQLSGLILEKDQRNCIETVKRFVCGEKKRDS